MRALAAALMLMLGTSATLAGTETDRLLDALGIPALIAAFSVEGVAAGAAINDSFLDGQGGDVWAETVRRLYDPARLEAEMRRAFAASLDPEMTAQALLFFESDLGVRLVALEVQARQAMLNPELESAAMAAPAASGDRVTGFLAARDLVARNGAATMAARAAFFDGLALTARRAVPVPDIEAQREKVMAETESWLRGYYALAQSPFGADEIAIYTAFWETDVGQALDDSLYAAFGASYASLSYGLGQAAGRRLPQNEL